MPWRVAKIAVSMFAYAVIMQVIVFGDFCRIDWNSVRPSTSGRR